MSFLKKNIFDNTIFPTFFFSLLVVFSFAIYNKVSAAPMLSSVCNTQVGVCVLPGDTSHSSLGGCDTVAPSMSENQIGICSDKGNGSDTPCCQKKPLCSIPCQNGCPGTNPRDTTKTCSQAGLFCCGALIPGSTPNSVASCQAVAGGECVNQPPSGVTVCPTGKKLFGVCSTTGGGNSNVDCCVTDTSGAGSCTAPGVPAGCTTPVPGASASIPFTNPIGFTTVEGLFGGLMGALQGIIVVLALVFIVIGAVIYVTSAGNDERMKTAKGAIAASMIGLALAIAAPSFLKEIYSVLDGNLCANLTGAELTACQQSITSITASSTQSLTQLSLKVLQFLLSIIGVLGIIMLVIGGLAYLTSAGDEERAGTGKKIITYAIIGIAVALASLIIVTQVAKLFV